MSTLHVKVFKHHKKGDGTYNVKIELYHRKQVYLDTDHYVSDKQLNNRLIAYYCEWIQTNLSFR
jgi:hypothetical protein